MKNDMKSKHILLVWEKSLLQEGIFAKNCETL